MSRQSKAQLREQSDEVWVAAMPDVAARLRRGGRIADIGSHVGQSSIDLAREFPRVVVDAVSDAGPYDLVAALDGRDDVAHSLRALRRMRQLASPGGTVLVAAGEQDDALVDAVYARAAGFSKVDVLPTGNPARCFFRLTP